MTDTLLLTGGQLTPSQFTVAEFDTLIAPAAIRDILDGRLAGVLLRQGILRHQQDEIRDRLRAHAQREAREGAAEGSIVGAYHYGYSTEDYLERVEETQADVASILGEDNPVDRLMDQVARAVEPLGQEVRLAGHGPTVAAQARVATWSTPGKYLLKPHEDAAQLTSPDLADMEISRMHDHPIVAANIYVGLPPAGGHLRIWNIDPDEESRRRAGTEHTGYYYPEEALSGVPEIEVRPEAGSILLLNARLIHAVLGYDDRETSLSRVSINFLMGRLDSRTVIYWA